MKEHKEGKGDLACLTLNLLSNSARFTLLLFSTSIWINSGARAEASCAQYSSPGPVLVEARWM